MSSVSSGLSSTESPLLPDSSAPELWSLPLSGLGVYGAGLQPGSARAPPDLPPENHPHPGLSPTTHQRCLGQCVKFIIKSYHAQVARSHKPHASHKQTDGQNVGRDRVTHTLSSKILPLLCVDTCYRFDISSINYTFPMWKIIF